ncbi:MAG: hypothetical protein JST16_05455 [Bdellovibrionales bacterium]|nr:hypothetical protein [Bdellovibrionales bacterium]
MVREILWIGQEDVATSQFLAPHGYRVNCVANAQDALSRLRAKHVFAVVVEDSAPEFFAEKTIREIAAQRKGSIAVRILLSRRTLSERMRQRLGYDFGMCVLDVPFDLNELVSILDDFLAVEPTVP